MTESKNPSFAAAMKELESILRRVEGEEIDIDELADELKRAAVLLETCRAKIRRAEVEVSQIVQNLDAPGREGAASEANASDIAGPEAAAPEAAAPEADEPEGESAGTASLFGELG